MSVAKVIEHESGDRVYFEIAEAVGGGYWITWSGIYSTREGAIREIQKTKGVQYVKSNVKT